MAVKLISTSSLSQSVFRIVPVSRKGQGNGTLGVPMLHHGGVALMLHYRGVFECCCITPYGTPHVCVLCVVGTPHGGKLGVKWRPISSPASPHSQTINHAPIISNSYPPRIISFLQSQAYRLQYLIPVTPIAQQNMLTH